MPGQAPSLTCAQDPITNWCCETVSEISFKSLIHGHSFSPAVKAPCVKKSVVARRSKACISVGFTEIICGYFLVIFYTLAPLKSSRYLGLRSVSTRRHSWLKHSPPSKKVASSIPDSIIEIFHWYPSGRTMNLVLARTLTEMSTRNSSWGGWVKLAGAWGWQTYHFNMPIVLKAGRLNLLEPSGAVQACSKFVLLLHSITLRVM